MALQLTQLDLSHAYRSRVAARKVQESFAKLTSGKKLQANGDDSAAFAQSLRLESQQKRDVQNLQNLQGLISYTQSQETCLNKVGQIIDRMGVLATHSLDISKGHHDSIQSIRHISGWIIRWSFR